MWPSCAHTGTHIHSPGHPQLTQSHTYEHVSAAQAERGKSSFITIIIILLLCSIRQMTKIEGNVCNIVLVCRPQHPCSVIPSRYVWIDSRLAHAVRANTTECILYVQYNMASSSLIEYSPTFCLHAFTIYTFSIFAFLFFFPFATFWIVAFFFFSLFISRGLLPVAERNCSHYMWNGHSFVFFRAHYTRIRIDTHTHTPTIQRMCRFTEPRNTLRN